MKDQLDKKYICIHGHFYQPPRENPWLGVIEHEDSASPYHDWNERIDMECYRANTAARLVDDRNKVLRLVNNYKHFSFNFGPTLLQWLEHHDPWVYRAILRSDRQSVELRNGHGNAIAQVYNHIIMPLANQRDKVTQVEWGIRDFEHRFGRRPEGMWLAETAVDRSTLAVLADAGIKFTILSPYQAARWRFIQEDPQWRDAGGGSIPTGRAYRYHCGAGKYIHIFFYDAELARGVAFERLLEHSSRLVGRIDSRYEQRSRAKDEPFLINTATDGESYGHHFKFGDMALAAAFEQLERDPAAEITNYAAFLASFPVIAEVEILENTAWSCSHGLGRWSRDCGCHIGGGAGWNQKWREPLRAALDFVRDTIAVHFETEVKKLCQDPWKARNEYVDVLLGGKEHLETFLKKHLGSSRETDSAARFLELLEMQRFGMLMYTSCGWFFDEISQLETMLVIRNAARAIQIAQKTGAAPIEDDFIAMLRHAPSNLAEFADGGDVYLKKIKPEVVEIRRVAATHAIQTLALSSGRQFQVYGYSIIPEREDDLGANPVPCLFGHIKVKDSRTRSEEDFLYAVLHFGGLDFRCSVKPFESEDEYRVILRALQDCIEEQSTIKMLRLLDEKFGAEYFGLHDVFQDLRSAVALEIGKRTLKTYTELQRSLYHTYMPLISSLRQWKIQIPTDLRMSSRRVLSDEAEDLVQRIIAHERENLASGAAWDETDFYYRAHIARLSRLLDEAKSWSVALQFDAVCEHLGQALMESAAELRLTFDQREAGRLYRLLSVCDALRIKPENWKLQTLYFEFISIGLQKPELFTRIKDHEEFLRELDRMLGCRFSELYIPASPRTADSAGSAESNSVADGCGSD